MPILLTLAASVL